MRIILILIVLILSACNNVKRTMGITQETPDEYTVMPQKKLIVPDQIHIPDPHQDMEHLIVQPVTNTTKALLIGERPAKVVHHNPKGEQALLQHLPTQPEPNIRKVINKDNKKPDRWNDQLLFWQKQVKGKPLDAAAEAERLKVNKVNNETISPGS